MIVIEEPNLTVHQGDALEVLKSIPKETVQCVVTSPPYWGLRDYGVEGQIGLEKTPEEFIGKLVEIFSEVHRVLRHDGTMWINIGDSYAGSWGAMSQDIEKCTRARRYGNVDRPPTSLKHPVLKPKDLVGVPWRLAFALQAEGWYLRSEIIWHKPSPMPESVLDRPTKSHEQIFLLSKSEKYYYNADAIKEPAICGPKGSQFVNPRKIAIHPDTGKKPRPSAPKGSFNGKTEAMADSGQNAFCSVVEYRNKRSVWTVASQPFSEAHFATYPPDLIKPCILAGSKVGDTVLDPFAGSGTTGQVAIELGRKSTLIELNASYINLIRQRTKQSGLPLS